MLLVKQTMYTVYACCRILKVMFTADFHVSLTEQH